MHRSDCPCTAQGCSCTAQTKAAASQFQRRKWNLARQDWGGSIAAMPDHSHKFVLNSSTRPYKFTALSYVWGGSLYVEKIYIGTKWLFIGSNLHDALKHLRQKKESITIWADAVCINQRNVQERNHRVQRMRDIYSTADHTIIYLGNEKPNNTTRSAWRFLLRQSDWFHKTYPNLHADFQNGFRDGHKHVEYKILTFPWFRRVWVLQEVVVSKKVFIQSGFRRIRYLGTTFVK